MTLKLYNPDDRYESDDQLIEAIESADIELVRQRLAGGSDADSLDGRHFSALMMAAERGYLEILEMLLDAGADPIFNVRGYHALDAAVSFGHLDIVKRWIERGLEIEAPERHWSALASAATHNNCEAIEMLLDAGADVNLSDAHYHSPLWWAMINDCREAATLLRDAGATLDPNDTAINEFELPPVKPMDLVALSTADRFQDALKQIQDQYGCRFSECSEQPGIYECVESVTPAEAGQISARAGQFGYRFIYTEHHYAAGPSCWKLFPTDDLATILSIMETNGENYGISTRKVVAALSELNQQNPFEILGAGLDFADIRFCESIHDPLALAHEIYDICPDSVEQHCGTITNLANQIDQTRRLYLWWD